MSRLKKEPATKERLLSLVVFALVLLVVASILLNGQFKTGKVSLDVQSRYGAGEIISGPIEFNLKAGELIPKESRVIATLNGQSKEFPLSELITNQNVVFGNFYAEGSQISGTGQGYGVAGTKLTYPNLDFEILITKTTETPDQTTPSPEPSPNPETPKGGEVGITGNVVSITERVVSGRVSKDNDFVIPIDANETASIVAGSVKIDGAPIGDDKITLSPNSSTLTVFTYYAVTERDFGADYLGTGTALTLDGIDLQQFGLNASQSGILDVKLVYNDTIIAEQSKQINVQQPEAPVINEIIENKSSEPKYDISTVNPVYTTGSGCTVSGYISCTTGSVYIWCQGVSPGQTVTNATTTGSCGTDIAAFGNCPSAGSCGVCSINGQCTTTNTLLYWNSTDSVIANSSITNSAVDNSTVSNSTIYNSVINGATIKNSTIQNSTIFNSTILNISAFKSNFTLSSMNNSVINNSIITNSILLNSQIINSFIYNSFIDPSTIINSNVTGSNVTDSIIQDSNATYSNITNSVINSSNVYNSVLTNVNSTNCTITNVTLSDYVCNNGTVLGISACGVLNQPNMVYVLTTDLTASGATCFTILADNITLDGLGHRIDGVTKIYGSGNMGVYVFNGYNNATVKNLNITRFDINIYSNNNNYCTFSNNIVSDDARSGIMIAGSNNLISNNLAYNNPAGGIQFDSANNNIVINNTLSNNAQYGFYFRSVTNNNTLLNNIMYGNTNNEIYDTGSGTNYLVYNNSLGEIRWTGLSFLSQMTTKGALTFPGNITISSNSAYFNPTGFTGNINSSANITLYGLPTNFATPKILKDGAICTDCYNFTSLNAGTVVFNVSSWSNYTIGTPTVIPTYACGVLSDANMKYVLMQDVQINGSTCFTIGADNITLDGQDHKVTGNDVAVTSGVYATGRMGLIVKGLNISHFDRGIILDTNNSNNIIKDNFLSSTIDAVYLYYLGGNNSVINNTAVSNTRGLSVSSISNNLIANNTFNSNTQYGMYITSSNNNQIINNVANSNTRHGIYLPSANNNILIGNTLNSNVLNGIDIETSWNNTLVNLRINNSGQDAILFGMGPSFNTNFTNITVTNTNASYYDINFSFSGNGTYLIDTFLDNYSIVAPSTVYFKNSQYGEIKYISTISGGGNNLSADIMIGNNSVYVNSSQTGLNKSANITLYNIGNRGFVRPAILKDGLTCATCTAYTSLTAGTVIFGVTSWSNYSIGEDTTPPPASSDSGSGEWRMLGRYLNRTGFIEQSNAPSILLSQGITNFSEGSGSFTSPVIANGYIYVSRGNDTYQLTESTMQKVAVFSNRTEYAFGSPVVAGNYVYLIGLFSGKIYQLNASNISTGIISSTVKASGVMYGPPAVTDGSLYVSNTGNLYRLNASNLSQQFASVSLSADRSSGYPTVANGYVYLNTISQDLSNYYLQFNATTLSQISSEAGGHYAGSGIVASKDYVYHGWGSDTGGVFQQSASNIGTSIASFNTAGATSYRGCLGNGYFYITDSVSPSLGNVYQLNASNITQKISNYTSNAGGCVVTENYLFVDNVYSGMVYQLNASNISQNISSVNLSDNSIYPDMVISNGYLYVYSSNYLYKISGGLTVMPTSPANGTVTNVTSQNFTGTAGSRYGLQNATLNIYNQTGLYNRTTITFPGNPLSATFGIVVTLIDGVYNWFWEVADILNNYVNSQITYGNYTITEDTQVPLIQFITPTETNGSVIGDDAIDVNVSASDANLKNISIYLYNASSSLNQSVSSTSTPFYYRFAGLTNGTWYFNASAVDVIGNVNYTETRSVNLNFVPISACGTLSSANTVYKLMADITYGSGTCFTIAADNITLDGQGHVINGVTPSGSAYSGIAADGVENLIIKNINVTRFDRGIAFGVVSNSVNNSIITNVNVSSNGWDGIRISTESHNNTVTNSIIMDSVGVAAGDGIIIDSYSTNNTVSNSIIKGNLYGIRVWNAANDNQIINNTISNNSNYGIFIRSNTAICTGNQFINNNVYGNTNKDIYDEGSGKNYLVYNNSLGEIRWTDSSFLSQMTTTGSLTFPGTIVIANNSAYFNPAGFTGNINSAANITLYGVPQFVHPAILRDGYTCPEGICHAFTSLNAGTVIFSVSGFSNYSIGEDNSISSDSGFNEWRMLDHDLNRSGYTNSQTTSNISNTKMIKSQAFGERILSQVVVANGYAYAVDGNSGSGTIIQLNASNVSQLINRNTNLGAYGAAGGNGNIPAIGNKGYLYTTVGTALVQVNATNVSLLYAAYNIGSSYAGRTGAAVAGGYVYFGSGPSDNKIYQVDAGNVSKLIATVSNCGADLGSISVWNGYAYTGCSGTNIVYQLNASNISIKISNFTTINSYQRSTPIIANGYLYACDGGGVCYRRNASNIAQGYENSSALTGSSDAFQIAYGYGNIYITSGSTTYRVYQLNASNVSQLLNQVDLGGRTNGGLAVANGYVFVETWDNNGLYQLNATNVSLIVALNTSMSSPQGTPSVANGYVYAADGSAYVYQFGDPTLFVTSNTPTTGTYTNVTEVNFTGSAAGPNALVNATLNIYNQTGLYNRTTIFFTGNPLTATFGIVVSLIDGVYNWFWEVTDILNNHANTQTTSGNYTVTEDTTPPVVHLVLPSNGAITTVSLNQFTCNAADFSSVSSLNISIWNSTGSVVASARNALSGTFNSSSWNITLPYNGDFLWNCYGCDGFGSCGFSSEGNYTIVKYTSVASPLSFVSPTPANGASIYSPVLFGATALINASLINQYPLRQFNWNWEGVNYNLYDDTLKLMLNFDNQSSLGENATFFADLSSLGNNGSCSSASGYCPTLVPGRYGSAYKFDAVDDEIQTPALPDSGSTVTVSFWINPEAYGPSMNVQSEVIASGDGIANGFVMILTQNTNLCGNPGLLWGGQWNCGPGHENYAHGAFPPLNQWTQVVGTSNATTMNLYYNGVLNATRTDGSSISHGGGIVDIGGGKAGFNEGTFNGSLDDVRVWNRSLTADEVREVYMSSMTKYNSTNWDFYINQSQPSRNLGLDYGVYNYYASALDANNNSYLSDLRNVKVRAIEDGTVNFTAPTPADGASTTNTSILLNVSMSSASPLSKFAWQWNGVSYPIYDDTLKLMLNFDNQSSLGENATFFADLSSLGNNGSCSSASGYCPTLVPGRYGSAMQFDAVDDEIQTPALPNSGSTVTVSLWVNIKKWGYGNSNAELISSGDGSSSGFLMWLTDYTVGCPQGGGLQWGGQWSCDYAHGDYFPLNQWVHIVGTSNSSTMNLYYNGVLNASLSHTSISNGGGVIDIGGGKAGYSEGTINGTIDDVRVWNRSLTADEVKEVYMSSMNKYNSTSWDFYINQTKIPAGVVDYKNYSTPSTGLDYGSYVYQAVANFGNPNSTYGTEPRKITVNAIQDGSLNFTAPTPADGSSMSNGSLQANVTFTTNPGLSKFAWQWNGVSYPIYDDTLKLMLNFENRSSLGENATFFADLSSFGNNGSCSSASGYCPILAPGAHGSALQFDGIDDWVQTPALPNSGSIVTVSYWLKPYAYGSGNSNAEVVSSGNGAQYGVLFWLTTNTVGCGAGGMLFGGQWSCTSGDTYVHGDYPPLNQWTHVVGVSNATSMKIYYNGVLNATRGDTSINNGGGIYGIGGGKSGYTEGTPNMSVDDLRVWNRTLSADEVRELYMSTMDKYNSTSWDFYINQTSPLGYSQYEAFAADKNNVTYQTGQRTTSSVQAQQDTISPTIDYVAPTYANDSHYNRTFILVNITSNDTNPGAITIHLYNSTLAQINSASSVNSPLYANFSGLSKGIYYFSATAVDTSGNSNSTEMRKVSLDNGVNVTSIAPSSGTYTNVTSINFTGTASSSVGLANATLNIYNQSGLYNRTTIFFTGNPLSATFGIVVSLIDGVYNWFWEVVDIANNYVNTQMTLGNYTISENTQVPIANFVDPTPANGSTISEANIEVNVSVTNTNIANITINLYNSSSLVNTTIITISPAYFNFAGLNNITYWFNATACNSFNQCNNSETRSVTINVTSVSVCGTLSIPNTYYIQRNNIIANQTQFTPCINIAANNITYDGEGYWISNASLIGWGILIQNQNYTIIKNVNISMNYTNDTAGIRADNTLNTVIKNSILTKNYHGIWLDIGNVNATISGNTIDSTTNHGIWLQWSNYTTIVNNTLRNSMNGGISMGQYANFNQIWNNTLTGGGYGISLTTNSSDNTASGNDVSNASYNFYVISGSNNNLLINNIISSAGSTGIILSTRANNNRIINNNVSNGIYGIYLEFNSSYNIVDRNNVYDTSSVGIQAQWNSTNNNFTNNVANGNANHGLQFSIGSDNNLAVNNTLNNNGDFGLVINVNSRNNQIINTSIDSSGWNQSSFCGGILLDSQNNTLTDVTVTNTNVSCPDISISSLPSNNLYMSNGTYLIDTFLANYTINASLVYFKNSQFGEIKFLQAISGTGNNLSADVKIGNNLAHVSSVQTGLNKSANITLYGLPTNFANPKILRDGSICTDCYNFTSLNAGTVIFNVSSWSDYSIGEVVGTCRVLSTPNIIYKQTANIIPLTEPCINITAQNVTYDGNGYWIMNRTLNKAAIYSNQYNTTIKNTNISMGNATGGNGIWLASGASNSLVTNNIVTDSCGGILLWTEVNNTIVSNNILNNVSDGITLESSSNNLVRDNLLISDINLAAACNHIGIKLESASINNQVINNTASGNSHSGISVLTNSIGNNITNNTGNSNVNGISVYTSSNNTLISYNNISGGTYGIYLGSGSQYTNVIRNSVNGTGYAGIYVSYSDHSNITSNNLDVNNQSGISLVYSNFSTLSNNLANNNGLNGINLLASSNNILVNNTVNNNTIIGVYLQTYANNNTIINNTANLNLYGISFGINSSSNLVKNNFVNGNQRGIYLSAVYATPNVLYNNVIDGNSVTNSTLSGIMLGSSISYTTVENNLVIGNNVSGIHLDGLSNYNNITNNTITGSQYGIELMILSGGNRFANNIIYNNSNYEIYDDGSGTNYLVYNNSFGEIRWTNSSFLSNLTTKGALTYPGNVTIANNSAYFNPSGFIGSINSSANVTLYNISMNFTDPKILKDGVICTGCHNFTSLNAGTVIFNVTSWSNYIISEENVPPSIQFITPTEISGSFINRSDIKINVNASDDNLANVTISLYNLTSLVNRTTIRYFLVDDDKVQCPTAAFTTIQSAINASSNGDLIRVCAGNYNGTIVVNKSVTLLGAQTGVDARDGRPGAQESIVSGVSPVSAEFPLSTVFDIRVQGVKIDGFTIQNASLPSGYGYGLVAEFVTDGLIITNNIFKASDSATVSSANINEIQANGADISQNLFVGQGPAGIDNGIYTDIPSSNIKIYDNKFVGQGNAAVLFTCTPGVFDYNESIHDNIFDTTSILEMDCSVDSVIRNNNITNALFNGIQISGGNTRLTVSNNTINGCGAGFSGIRQGNFVSLGNDTNLTITNNNITGCPNGIKFANPGTPGLANPPEIHDNNIYGNTIGLWNRDTMTINATFNWWGDISGPGGNVTDPVTSAVANGVGNNITIDGGAGSVNFDPFLPLTTSAGYVASGIISEFVTLFYRDFVGLPAGQYWFNATAADIFSNMNSTDTRTVTINLDSIVLNSTVDNSTIANSTVTDSNVTSSNITGSTSNGSIIDNSTVIDSNLTDSTVNGSIIDNSTVIDNSTIIDSNINSSVIDNSTIDNSTIIDSDINDSTLLGSNVTNSTVVDSSINNSVIDNSTIIDTNITDSTADDSTITNTSVINSNMNDSNVDNSTIIDSNIINSNVNDSSVDNSTITNTSVDSSIINSSTTDSSTITNSNISDSVINLSLIDNSSVVDSDVNNSVVDNSTIISSTVTDSNVSDSVIIGSNSTNSTIINSSVVDSDVSDLILINANVTNNTLYSGNVTYNGTTYSAATLPSPWTLQNIYAQCGDGICSGVNLCGSDNTYPACHLDCGSCPLSISGGGGGGGGGSSNYNIYDVNESQLSEGYTQTVNENDLIRIAFDDSVYPIVVSGINSVATLKIGWLPIVERLNPGEKRDIDIDGDGKYDITVTINSIDNHSNVNLTIKAYSLIQTAIEKYVSEKITQLQNYTVVSEAQKEVYVSYMDKLRPYLYSALIFVILGFIILVIFEYERVKKKDIIKGARRIVMEAEDKGYTDEEIKEAFRKKGWTNRDIEKLNTRFYKLVK